jgi:hypothetical protein
MAKEYSIKMFSLLADHIRQYSHVRPWGSNKQNRETAFIRHQILELKSIF